MSTNTQSVTPPNSPEQGTVPKSKGSWACADCKAVKLRCERATGESKCSRCIAKDLPCTSRERKKRKAAETHEDLLERSRNQDFLIEQLLREFDEAKAKQKLQALINEHFVNPTDSQPDRGSNDRVPGCGRWMVSGFSPQDACATHLGIPVNRLPSVIKECDLYPEEVKYLFSIFFDQINCHVFFADPVLHQPCRMIDKSVFLFTVICAIASRFYTSRPDVHPLAMHLALDLAAQNAMSGAPDMHSCQAYILLAAYLRPQEGLAQNRGWAFQEIAVRMVKELCLEKPVTRAIADEDLDPESINGMRTWLSCYCLESSSTLQRGGDAAPLDDAVAVRVVERWPSLVRLSAPTDVFLLATARVLAAVGLQGRSAAEPESKLSTTINQWRNIISEQASREDDQTKYMSMAFETIADSLKLVELSRSIHDEDQNDEALGGTDALQACIEDATNQVDKISKDLIHHRYLAYATRTHLVWACYPSAFLARVLCSPWRSQFHDSQLGRISSMAELLGGLGRLSLGGAQWNARAGSDASADAPYEDLETLTSLSLAVAGDFVMAFPWIPIAEALRYNGKGSTMILGFSERT